VFVLRQRRLDSPLLDLRLFGIRSVSGALVLGLLTAAIQGGSSFFLVQHLQVVEGYTPLKAALWLLVPTFGLLIGINVTQQLAQRIRPAYILTGGMVVAAIGQLVLTQVGSSGSLTVLIVGAVILYAGISPVGVLVSQLVMGSAPPEKAGSAASLQSTGGELGIALGIAALGSIGTAIYRTHVSVPGDVASTGAAGTAHETIAGALNAAQQLPAATAHALVTSAREAFTSGLNTVAAVCAALLVGLAVVAVATLRHVAPIGVQAQGAPPEAGSEEQTAEAPAA
jgi:DHA2 family multidrug resistance protein-like MFS transporter